ncbi:MAG: zinc-dependent peptidase [Kiritimatiellales bacterium]|nr:zinc-dependent peptidase [Kiritimatiellales bacterium]
MFFYLRAKARTARREKLFATPPPERWFPIIEKNLPVYGKLSVDLKRQLHGYMQVFLGEKKFEGCGGLEMTEEIMLAVAAQACMLLLNRKVPCYPNLKTILMYPHTYVSGRKGMFGGDNGEGARLGESWGLGVVVLSWDSVKGGAINFRDGHNVTFHEFAHQLDQADGAADGAPILPERSAYSAWARVFSKEYEQLCAKTSKGKKSTMDRYGATNPAEFFAVATETFFEKPQQLKEKHPELYKELRYYYRVDPIEWVEP